MQPRWKPMLAGIGERRVLSDPSYVFEPKLDGIRALCYLEEGRLTIFSRNQNDVTAAYPEFAFADRLRASSCVLDGEIVLYDQAGNPDFHTLVRRHLRGRRPRGGRPATFAVFDLLSLDAEHLLGRPLEERKERLRDVLGTGDPRLQMTVFTTDGPAIWKVMTERGLEGVIAKKLGSTYQPGRRSDAWLKVKAHQTVEAIIVGYRSDRRPLSSLALAMCDGETSLRLIGRVGTGFSDALARRLREMLDPIVIDAPPVAEVPNDYHDVVWTEPRYVCEVQYLEIGPQGSLRHPSFLRLRPDKEPAECLIEALQS